MAVQGAAAIVEFQATMQKEIDGATALAAAFNAGDNATAGQIVLSMTTTKKDGHKKFDPKD